MSESPAKPTYLVRAADHSATPEASFPKHGKLLVRVGMQASIFDAESGEAIGPLAKVR